MPINIAIHTILVKINMKKVLPIILCGLLLGAFALDAMADRSPAAKECAKQSCCCTPLIRGTDAHAAATCGMGEIVPSAHVQATCCHPSPIGHSAMDLALTTAPPAPAPLPHAGTASFSSQRILADQLTGGHGHYPQPAPPRSTGIPVYLATLSIRC